MKGIDSFIERWIGKHTMVPSSLQDLNELEEKLHHALPSAYKYLFTTYGLIHTPNVMNQACDLSVNIENVQDFLNVDDVYELTKLYQMSGMPQGYVVFASDCNGNMFCFKSAQCEQAQQDIPVWFYDRNTATVTQVSDSFIAWLSGFNK